MARDYLQAVNEPGTIQVPAELLDGIAVYESDLRTQVERTPPPKAHLTTGLDKNITDLKSRIKQQFTDRRKYGYRLHSVFIHRGTPAQAQN